MEEPETDTWFKHQADYTDSILNGLYFRQGMKGSIAFRAVDLYRL